MCILSNEIVKGRNLCKCRHVEVCLIVDQMNHILNWWKVYIIWGWSESWSTSPMKKGWGSWAWSAWRREGSGEASKQTSISWRVLIRQMGDWIFTWSDSDRTRGQVGWGPGQSELVGSSPGHSRRLELDGLSGSLPTQAILWFYDIFLLWSSVSLAYMCRSVSWCALQVHLHMCWYFGLALLEAHRTLQYAVWNISCKFS